MQGKGNKDFFALLNASPASDCYYTKNFNHSNLSLCLAFCKAK